jgi:hypothetical protein
MIARGGWGSSGLAEQGSLFIQSVKKKKANQHHLAHPVPGAKKAFLTCFAEIQHGFSSMDGSPLISETYYISYYIYR